jgi:hypothetical protein
LTVIITLIVVCGFASPQLVPRTGGNSVGDFDCYRVIFKSASEIDRIITAGVKPLMLADWGAYLRLTTAQVEVLRGTVNLEKVPDRTILRLPEQGIEFDTRVDYELAPEWRKPDTDLRIVQFVFPDVGEWSAGVEKIAGKVLRHIGDNAVVVKANPAQEKRILALDYVEWIGPYEPGFRVQEKLRGMTGEVQIEAFAFPGTNMATFTGEMRRLGAAGVEDSGYGSIVCRVDASFLPTIAGLDSVMLTEHIPEMKPMANVGGRIVQAHDLWVNTVSNLPQNIMGQGQIVHVQDVNIDPTHWDLNYGPLGDRLDNPDSTSDYDAHGTHVAGIVAGNGYCMETYLGLSTANRIYNELAASNPGGYPDRMGFAGRAPEARVYFRNGLVTTEWANGYTFGARIFTNAWGPTVITQGYSSTADSFMDTNPTALVLFAAGNHGPRSATVSGHGNGKLALSIGASENMRAVAPVDHSNDPGQIYHKSGRGPVSPTDLRIKPDLVEVGTYVYGMRTDDIQEPSLTGLYDWGNINVDGDDRSDYVAFSGTSPATAAAAGDAALIRDYLQDVQGISTGDMHANLIKTLMIHGAEDLGYGYPSYDQGWGRVNVRNSICPPAPNVIQWQHVNSGTTGTWDAAIEGGINLEVVESAVPIKFTMAHWDSTGSGALTTDYDLVVTAPDGTRYEGNAFAEGWSIPVTTPPDWSNAAFPSWLGGQIYDWDTADDGGDDVNNVEVIRIREPQTGMWTAQVVTRSSGGKTFSFAVTGGFAPQYDMNANQYRVRLELDSPRIVMERDDFGTAAFKGSPDNITSVGFMLSNGGTSTDSYALTATLPSGFIATFDPSSPVALNPGERKYCYVNVSVGSGVAQGSHTMKIRAMSNNDATAPIAQSEVAFQIDVVSSLLPWKQKVTDSPMHESHAAPVAWSSGGKNYIGLAYLQSGRFGERVQFKLSEDGGATWGQAVTVSSESIKPGWVTITRANSGTYAGRLMIAYSSYNPNGYNGDTADTRGNQIRVAYADHPYITWTEVIAFNNGEGPATGSPATSKNSYRTVNVVHYPASNLFYLIIEAFQHSDYTSDSLAGIRCIGKTSMNGGVTWSTWHGIDPGSTGYYLFYPHAYLDMNNNIALWFRSRDSSDSVTNSAASFIYYNGAWGTMRESWPYHGLAYKNFWFPQGVAAQQGPNQNRNYGMYHICLYTWNDGVYSHHYTDNAEGNPPTFDNNNKYGYGPLANAVASPHSYNSRWSSDMSYTTDDFVWATFFRHRNYDPYGQPNIITAYDPFPTGASPSFLLTADCMPKNKVRVAELGKYNFGFYDTLSQNGGADIWMVKYFHDWENNPSATINLTVEHWGPGGDPKDHNTLNWTYDGTGIAQFNIYRSDALVGPWNETTLIGNVPVGTNTYLDPDRGENDGTIWWYVVRAQNLVGTEEQNAYAVPEPGGPLPYAINLSGIAPGWVLVSFPVAASGNIWEILDDARYGDGQTTWDVAKWYDSRDAADPWKTYRFGGTHNDMPGMDNTMGMWLRLTLNEGDRVLTLGAYAPVPSSTQIVLYAGWNMVGYPSMTNRTADLTLPPDADKIAVWQAASPYIQDFSDLALVTMTHGNAYWVRVTADCVWNLEP